jgi:MerR family transcriptional regulator, light-induced transcriptional regulator
MADTEATDGLLTIAAVARDTGLGKDTLRVWERRYGFPQPLRDSNGDRVYPAAQVLRLRLLKRLLDLGHRPGRLMEMPTAELQQLANGQRAGRPDFDAEEVPEELRIYLDMCTVSRAEELRRALTQAMIRDGLRTFVVDTVAPLIRAAGDYWESGRLCVYEEHLFTEVIQNVLRSGISNVPHETVRGNPRIVLCTFPQENHGLGLLMAEAVFTLEGAQCISLGVQMPIDQIVLAGLQADVVALSFSTTLGANRLLDGLADLALGLADGAEIWCGGGSPALRRCQLANVYQVDLQGAAKAIACWRERHRH